MESSAQQDFIQACHQVSSYFIEQKLNLTELTPTAINIVLFIGFVIGCFITSIAANNYSQVDKLWSITPWIYAWVWTFASGGNARVTLMTVVTTIWGIRLTLNFNRRGGYTWPPWGGEEDYRWEHVRRDIVDAPNHPILWQIFNFWFVCVFQHLVLLWIVAPIQLAFAVRQQASPLGIVDIIAAGLFLGLVILEGMADNEQFDFQTEKYRLLKIYNNNKARLPFPYSLGFNTQGVFALSRHPNYFAEQSLWVVMHLFTFSALGYIPLTWHLGGCIVLIGIFASSLPLAERITLEKWPMYKKYQEQVPPLFPYGSGMKM
jgi:steroid 5-alpha reductase family enzyme